MNRWIGKTAPRFQPKPEPAPSTPASEPAPAVVEPKPVVVAPVLDFAQAAYYGNTEQISLSKMIHDADDRAQDRKKLGS